eukprot:TRINITY_DN5596_c1_g1_i7.p1 TRINITY_DN5596_c1_g1~~TRINITY_DN5596_c1_g1_i7.p1  ORF type:complete len:464 (-),score=11.55 TRINITY_DN5596_c1_g1_i7:474-1817(-)
MTGDWLYHTSTKRCHDGGWDNTPTTFFSCIFLTCWFAVAISAVLLTHTRALKSSDAELSDGAKSTSSGTRFNYLDIVRFLSVVCVVTEHSGGDIHSARNNGFVLHWVLPYLYLTSGICFMLSRAHLWRYQLRLFAVFAVGVGANWTADIVNGKTFDGNFGMLIFQMAYVAALIVMGVVSAPLRLAFRGRWSGGESRAVGYLNAVLAVLYLSFTIYALVCLFRGLKVLPVFDQPFWVGKAAAFKANSTVLGVILGSTWFLCSLSAYLGHSDLLGWILLAYIYVPRVIVPFPWVGFTHLVQLYFVGVATECRHLRGSQALNRLIRTYWWVIVIYCLLFSMPTMSGRCDVNSPGTYWERSRFYSIELFFTLALLSGALESEDPYGILEWAGKWALYAYCFHFAYEKVFPRPWGAVITYSSAILFYACHRCSKARSYSQLNDAETEKSCSV